MKQTARTVGRVLLAGTFFGLLLAGTPVTASAYADPGTGAFVYQAFYAGVLTGAFYLRKFVQKLRSKVSSNN
ncbi:MAG: hypothetical protein ABL995_19195 [Bryobacteraceae bacterium]